MFKFLVKMFAFFLGMNSKRCPIYYIVYAIYLHAHTLYNVADQRFEMLRYSGPVSGFADSFGLLHSFSLSYFQEQPLLRVVSFSL